MKDVAAHAGVALKTVSRVVNDEAGVSRSTRDSVLASISALGFRRNASAASLRQRQTASIGLIIEDISEPFQSVIARATERVAIERNVLLFTASSSDDSERERTLALNLASRPVDGLIIVPSAVDHGYLRAEMDAGLSVVFIDRPAPGIDADTVLTDNRRGARSGVEHLILHGHSRIAFVGDSTDFFTGAERFEGYCDAMRRAGIEIDPALITLGHPEPERIHRHLAEVRALAEPATALFTGNSLNTLVTLRVLANAPARLAHVAFDDFELFDLLTPGITVVAQDPLAMGTAAAEQLFRRIAGDGGNVQTTLLHTTLIERGSGELRP
jgi:LacI family transcriptional regulator